MNTEAGGKDFVIARVLDAARGRVWLALTESERLKQWWPPKSFTMISATMDLRPGGSFHCGMRSIEGYKMWGKFVYHEVVPPERLVFLNSFSNEVGELKRHPIVPTWPLELLTTMSFEDEPGGKTKLTVRWSPRNATEIEHKTFDMSHVGMKATWGAAFDQLAAYLAKAA
jgi:uncharacterized protein YndB with AHSA1/START domain